MDEIDGVKVSQCPYCGYQLARCGNESPGKDKDGNDVIVRDLFLACPHCGYRGPIAATWAEAMQKNQLQHPERNRDDVEQKRVMAIEAFRSKIVGEIESLIRKAHNLTPDQPFAHPSVEETEFLRAFEIMKKFATVAAKGDGWRELVDSLVK